MAQSKYTPIAHPPLWLDAALRIIADETAIASLSATEHQLLFEKAALVMKPSRAEWDMLAADRARQQAYILAFIRAYKADCPPLSGFTDARAYIQKEVA